jgi:hypothetical protein
MKNELIEEYLFPQDDKNKAAQWWNSLTDDKKIFLKDEFESLTSVDYKDALTLFTEEEVITILHQKLIREGILQDEQQPKGIKQ